MEFKNMLTDDEFMELFDNIDKLLVKSTSDEPTKQNMFDDEFFSEKYSDKFAGAVAMVMSISTITDIPLEEVFDMYVEKMRKELESDDTKALMSIGRLFLGGSKRKGEK